MTYNHLEGDKEWIVSKTINSRIVTDAFGTELIVTLEYNVLTIKSSVNADNKFQMNKSESQILKAFVDRALNMPRMPHDDEELAEDKSISLISQNTPYVRLISKESVIDIHPPSWTPLSCEIGLLLPRMKDPS